MTIFAARDGTDIFSKDWGRGRPVVFSYGWPLNADAWGGQMHHLADNGFRAIAHDRRGHGRSMQTFSGNDMDTYADDLAQLIEHLDLRDAVLVGHSTGGGEAALRSLTMPVLVVHGDDDQVVPFAATGRRSAALAPHATLKVHPGAPHAIPDVARDQLDADLLDFIRA